MNERLRESSHLPLENWTDCYLAMVPVTDSIRRNLEPRGPLQPGKMLSNIREAAGVVNLCGIYEWRATRPDQPNRVVYVGSTCTRNGICNRLRSRIVGYCKHGNHKEVLINDALMRGYELWVRVKQASGEEDAKAQENTLLAMYDYAWNIRNNNSIRYVL